MAIDISEHPTWYYQDVKKLVAAERAKTWARAVEACAMVADERCAGNKTEAVRITPRCVGYEKWTSCAIEAGLIAQKIRSLRDTEGDGG